MRAGSARGMRTLNATVVNGTVVAEHAVVMDDHKMATLIVFTLFIVVLMAITISKECTAAGRRAEYQKATAEGEGVELVITSADV